MKTIRLSLACIALFLLAGCAAQGTQPQSFDLGPLPASGISVVPAPLSIAEISPAAWLDSTGMAYRLSYSSPQQPRLYATTRWSTTPAQLFGQRLKGRIGQAGGVALPAADGASGLPLLRIELDDFSQDFDSPSGSSGRIALRASVYRGRVLVAHQQFARQAAAPTPDAAGGASALAAASDALISDLMAWLGGLPAAK